MTPEFQRALHKTLKVEGGYIDAVYDRGGPTNLGVTLDTLRAWFAAQGRPEPGRENLRLLTRDAAARLYYDLYWCDKRLPCQRLAEWWELMAQECFDTAVHSGPAVAARLLQRALNLVNLNERAWPDIATDGWVGDGTLALLRDVDKLPRGRERLLLAVNAYQGKYLIEIAEHDPTQEAFVGGWLLHRVRLNASDGK